MRSVGEIMNERFETGTSPRSSAYRQGTYYLLRRKIEGIPQRDCPFKLGTASADAWQAGVHEGLRLFREERDRLGEK